MKKTGRKLFGIFLSLVMVLGLMPGMSLTAWADDDTVTLDENNIFGNSYLVNGDGDISISTTGDAAVVDKETIRDPSGGGSVIFTSASKQFSKITIHAGTVSDYGIIQGWSTDDDYRTLTWEGIPSSTVTLTCNEGFNIKSVDSIVFTLTEPVNYPLWVGGTQVTSANAADILGDADEGATASYDAENNTLTLNGYTYSGSDVGARYTGTDTLNIVLTGENKITCTGQYGVRSENAGISFSGEGSLDVTAVYFGIHAYSEGNYNAIVISGGTVSATSTAELGSGIYGGDLTISGGTVNATATGYGAEAVYGKNISISGGTFNAYGTGDYSLGMHSEKITITSGINSVIISGTSKALRGKVVNEIYGVAYENIDSSEWNTIYEGEQQDGELENYKKVQFPKPPYTVKLNTNGGTINSGDVTEYYEGTGATLPTDVTRTGYTFDGWYDNENLTGTAVTAISATDTGNKEFWAKWTRNVENLDLDKIKCTIKVGETIQLRPTVTPDDATDKTVIWSSNNTSVATVDNEGVVTGVSAGFAAVTVTATNGTEDTDDDKYIQCRVVVVSESESLAGEWFFKENVLTEELAFPMEPVFKNYEGKAEEQNFPYDNYKMSLGLSVSGTYDGTTYYWLSGNQNGEDVFYFTIGTPEYTGSRIITGINIAGLGTDSEPYAFTPIQVDVKTTNTKPFTLIASASDTVSQIKAKLIDMEDSPYADANTSEIGILYGGTELEDAKSLSDYNIKKDKTIEVVRKTSYSVTFKVVNGSWDDDTTTDKTVTLTGHDGDTLKLAADQIPAVGSKPSDTYKAGNWDVTPSTETAITEATTYTYTYVAKEASVVTKAPKAKTLTYNGQAQELVTAGTATGGEMQYALGNATEATQPYTTSIPAKTDAGTYYVWYKVVGDENHNDTEPKSVTVTIGTNSYAIVADAQDWTKGSSSNLTVTFKGTYADEKTYGKWNKKVLIDGAEISTASYDHKAGSLVIDLKPAYLETLSTGKHTISVTFSDGSASGTFNIKAKSSSGGGSSKPDKKTDNVVTCQMAGYPANYAWNEAAKACQPGYLDNNGVFHPTSSGKKSVVPNTNDKGLMGSVVSLSISMITATVAAFLLKKYQ